MVKLNNRPLILVTNDDGYKAKGLAQLTKVAMEFGDVVVIAASESQSGQSHAITIKNPLKYKLLDQTDGLTRYVIKGTPVDGVKMAMCSILDRKPDLVLSGINHGSNSSTSVFYSGTMGATIEGAINQIPSIGFSLLDYSPDADFEPSAKFLRSIIGSVIEDGLAIGICLNVNIPAVSEAELQGIKICRQTNGYWKEVFDERKDPHGGKYYWLTGSFINREEGAEDSDEWALKQNYVSVVPIKIDMTAYDVISALKKWELNLSVNEKDK